MKKKNSLALFEVISKGKEKRANDELNVPGWMGRRSEAPAPAPPPRPEPPRARTASASPMETEPVWSVSFRRVRISLSYPQGWVAAGAVAAALAVVFLLGRYSASPAKPAGAPGSAGTGEVYKGEPEPLPGGLQAGQDGSSAKSKREVGKSYLVIQTMQGLGEREEADRIAQFCTANAVDADVALWQDGKTKKRILVVWALKPTDMRKETARKELAQRVEKIGEKYFAKYKTYQMKQPLDKLWFQEYTEQMAANNP
jgi:hypothetical protein